jgi:DNA-directed RNA polymerase, mitochondrial
MDQELLPDEFNRSITKLDKADLRKELSHGWGATTGGKAITSRLHEQLTEGVRYALLDAHSGSKAEAQLVITLRGLSPELIALSCLQSVLNSIGLQERLRNTFVRIGSSLAAECFAADLTLHNPRIAARIVQAVKLKHGNVDRRQAAARAAASHLDGFKSREWSKKALVIAGGWAWNVMASSLPGIFVRELIVEGPCSRDSAVTISPDAWAIVDAALEHAVTSNPVFWPSAQEPKPWTTWNDGGAWDVRVNGTVSFLRSFHKDTHALVRHAIKTGQMKPAVDALNGLQAVPFKINTRVAEVLQICADRQLPVAGIPAQSLPVPPKAPDAQWSAMDKAQRGLWKAKLSEIRKVNSSLVGDRILFREDMITAEAMSKLEAFYTPMNCDWRGRVYGLCHFNFQREDRVRALFLFADGLPIGTEGLRWLKIHVANTGDFGKISKRPIEERVQWCDDNIQQITNTASDPFAQTEWMQADKPFLHLAACFELSAALAQGSSYVTHLPTSYDGSCSGLQHLCAMTRAAEGSMVNLTPSALPQDVYQAIADQTKARVEGDTENTDLAKLFLEYGVDRKLVKRNVMTYAYSSKKYGMASQQQTDLLEPLSREVLEGKLEEHPFDGYQHGPWDKKGNQQPSKAARFISGHVFSAIETSIHKPAEAMQFLQGLAKALAHEGRPVCWTTPVGIPWVNRYHEADVTKVELFLNDGGLKVRAQVSIATGRKKEIDKAKAANGVAPNFVHALDAAHLLLVANAAAGEGITSIATVHDSFGCLAPQAARFNQVIREQFAQMYEDHDVLAEILERATADLTPANRNKLPTLPSYGPLNLKDVLNADFAFA